MNHQPWKTNKRERELNVKNGLRPARTAAVVAVLILAALVSCVAYMFVVYAWEYLVLGK